MHTDVGRTAGQAENPTPKFKPAVLNWYWILVTAVDSNRVIRLIQFITMVAVMREEC